MMKEQAVPGASEEEATQQQVGPTETQSPTPSNAALQDDLNASQESSSLWDMAESAAGGILGAFGFGGEEESETKAAEARPDLDAVLDGLEKQSPTLASGLQTARQQGWVFVWGSPGAGTATDHHRQPPTVTIDPAETTEQLARSMAHELGHVLDGETVYEFDQSMDRDTYISTNTVLDLEGEAEATIMELKVRDDVLTSGTDIGITGATADEKISLWEEHKTGKLTRDQLVAELVDLFAHREQPSTDPSAATYWDFYAKAHAEAWDKNNPTPTPLPIPQAP
jgi:hypothetical protein